MEDKKILDTLRNSAISILTHLNCNYIIKVSYDVFNEPVMHECEIEDYYKTFVAETEWKLYLQIIEAWMLNHMVDYKYCIDSEE